MTVLKYDFLFRLLTRAEEIASEPDMHRSVITVYNGVLKAPADAFCQARNEITAAATALGKHKREARKALDALDPHYIIYKVARSVILAFAPETVLPNTLKSQPTDTDQPNAIKSVFAALNKHIGQAWAAEVLAGELGTQGAAAEKALANAIASSKALSKARSVRALSAKPAYESLIAWRRVVRDALGPQSKQHRRLAIPRNQRNAAEEEEAHPAAKTQGEVPAQAKDSEKAGAPEKSKALVKAEAPQKAEVPVPVEASARLRAPVPVEACVGRHPSTYSCTASVGLPGAVSLVTAAGRPQPYRG